MNLRPYQERDIKRIADALRLGGRVLYRLPTGGGKTVIFTHIAKRMAEVGKRVLILTHRRTLVKQTASKIYEADIDYGVIASDHSENLAPLVQVASVQTLARRLKRIAEHYDNHIDLIIVDEAHHTISDQFLRVLNKFGDNGRLLGVSATPIRLDGAALNPPYDTLVVGESEERLIADGYLADYSLFLPPGMHDPLYNRQKRGEITRAEREKAEAADERSGDAVGLYKTHLNGRQAIAFCYSIADSIRVSRAFCAAGIVSEAVSSKDSDYDVNRSIQAYDEGHIKVLCSCDLISEGFDMPETSGVLMMRKTESLTVFLQQIGRAMRPKADGGKAIIIDMVNNTSRHGLPDLPIDWSLEGKDKETKAPGIRRCPHCYSIAPSHATVCKHCGRDFPVKSDAELEAGEFYSHDGIDQFAEVDKENWRKISNLYGQDFVNLVREAKTEEEIHKIAKIKGYDGAWVKHVMYGKNLNGDTSNEFSNLPILRRKITHGSDAHRYYKLGGLAYILRAVLRRSVRIFSLG